jgi:anti-sigma B factor antagonist
MNDALTISVSPEPGYVVVSVAGEIDMATAAQFREQLASVISGGARRVVVDLARVTFMASAGVAVLAGTHRVLAAQGGSLVLASPSPAAGRVLSLAGVDQVIPVTGSVADAAARWASEGVELVGAVGLEPTNPSLVSVVILVDNQGRSGWDLRKQVLQDTRKSASVRGDCHPVSHPIL